jgi:hypothetical protein
MTKKEKPHAVKHEPRIAITARAVTISTQHVKRRHKPSALVKVAGGPARSYPNRKRLVLTVRGAASTGVAFLRRSDSLWRGLDDYYREYCRNFLVRGSIDARAFWATKEGFETVIEDAGSSTLSQEKKDQLKAYIDKINGDVNLDNRLRLALIKAPIWGKAGFEIEFQKKDAPWVSGNQPVRLNSLKSTLLAPKVNEDAWKLSSFEYNGKPDFYKPEEVLFFVRSEIDDDWQGRSDIEPVLVESILDDRIIREDLMEAATTLWAGIAVHQLNLEKAAKAGITTDEDIDKIMEDYRQQLRPGKHVVTDDLWDIQVHDLKPDLGQLLDVSDKLERRILGSFKVPRFLLNIEKELNRATAEKELEAFVEGPITDEQRWLKRIVESQWYDRLTRQFLQLKLEDPLPVRVVHRWRQIRIADWLNLLDVGIRGYGESRGPLSLTKFYELLRDGEATKFDPKEVASQPAGQPVEIPLDIVARPKKRTDQSSQPATDQSASQ